MDVDYQELEVPPTFAAHHARHGGRKLRRFVARSGCEFLRVMLAEEPTKLNPFRDYEQHLSLSVAASDHANCSPSRPPTSSEVKATKRWFERLGFRSRERFDGAGSMLVNFWGPLA